MHELMSREEFTAHARSHNVIPVAKSFIADGHTPVSLYKRLCGDRTGTFLLESAEGPGLWSRYSFIGINSPATIVERQGMVSWKGTVPVGAPTDISFLDAVRKLSIFLTSPKLDNLPPLTGGLVGYLGYETVRKLEKISDLTRDDLNLPSGTFMITSDLAVFDHLESKVYIICNAINWDACDNRIDEAYDEACARIAAIEEKLLSHTSLNILPTPSSTKVSFQRNTEENQFISGVVQLKEEIAGGEAFQIVLSQRFEMKLAAPSFDVYRALRITNPSPYMFYFNLEKDFFIVGSSPEALIKINERNAIVHPIAGTRPRGQTPEQDSQLAEELLADPKERAEHLMLVDLGRNDLGRVCESGSVSVIDFMSIERYSHVMHIVSTVVGKIKKSIPVFDAILSVFPAGTLSGAPKPRAMELIEEHEVSRRGVYGGAIGYLDFVGNVDTCIAIRTAVIKGDKAYIQAGAGVVADSDPMSENQETINKAMAVMRAVATANAWVK